MKNDKDLWLFGPEVLHRLENLEIGSIKLTRHSSEIGADEGSLQFTSAGTDFRLRPLRKSDFHRGFIQLLGELTEVGEITEDLFETRFDAMRACSGSYFVLIVEDRQLSTVVATATVVVEQKFIRNCALRGRLEEVVVSDSYRGKQLDKLLTFLIRGRLEEVVVSDSYRGKQLGKLLVSVCTRLAEQLGCYKISLDCRDHMLPFYNQLGYVKETGAGNFLTVRFRGERRSNEERIVGGNSGSANEQQPIVNGH